MSSLIKVMISSRCNDTFPTNGIGVKLSDIRKELKQEIEDTFLFSKQLFEVWINEETPPQGGTWDSWDTCMEAVKDCDIFISIFNGHAGWANERSENGICHAELIAALTKAPAKVRLISIGDIAVPKDDNEKERNERFVKYVNNQNLFRGGEIISVEHLKTRVKEAVFDAVQKLTLSGVHYASQGKFHSGEPLEWSRLSYQKRHDVMVDILIKAIENRPGSRFTNNTLYTSITGKEVLIVPNAIPDAISVSQAKEMVGQPFLRDHLYFDLIESDQGGPVHIIACHKGATEIQAKKLLGFPDATVVDAPFGIFVADNIQKVQFVFIRDCRDESTTRIGVQRFFEWLKQTGEDYLLSKRAISRAKIIKTVADELR